jgi:hypothetical protein
VTVGRTDAPSWRTDTLVRMERHRIKSIKVAKKKMTSAGLRILIELSWCARPVYSVVPSLDSIQY